MAEVVRDDSAAEKQFRTLRPHNKSRQGCTNCKKRKVKCDETRPTCGSCRLRSTACEYALSRNANTSTAISLLRDARSNASKDIVPFELGNRDRINTLHVNALTSSHLTPIDYTDMKVMWFYTSATCRSLSVEYGDPLIQDALQNAVVRSAFEAPFLMKTILALTSQHMQSLRQGIGAGRSLEYCGMAFEGHRQAIAEATPKTYGALCANALLLALLSSPSFGELREARLLLIDWMVMWRGLGSVFDITGFECIAANGLDPLFSRPALHLDDTTAHIPRELLQMLSLAQAGGGTTSETSTYHETLRCLGTLHVHLSEHGYDTQMAMRIITWFTIVPSEFVDLARTQQPCSLAILAHYSGFLKLVESVWWLAGVGDTSIYDIWRHLGPEWHEYIQLPLSVLGIVDQSQVRDLLLRGVHQSDTSRFSYTALNKDQHESRHS